MSTIIDRSSPTRAGYLVRDEFTTDLAAGAVNGTSASPGPGVRVVVDGNAKLSISSGAVGFATGGVAAGDPGLWWIDVGRAAGRLLTATATLTVGTLEIGFDTNQAGGLSDSVRITTTNLQVRSGSVITVATIAAATAYRYAVVTRATGAVFFVKGGAFSTWTLIWVSKSGTTTNRFVGAIVATTSAVAGLSSVRVPATLWLPVPLASDGFGGTFDATDGRGHAEGVAGGLGSGGAGLVWSQALGTWQTAGGVASAATLSASVAIAVVDTGAADVIATLRYTHSAGTGAVLVRYVDASNWVAGRHTGTNAQLVKNVAGVQTTLIDVVTAYVAGAELRISAVGSAFRLYYNDALIGTEQTIADAELQSGTRQGIRSTDTGNTFDDFVVYARGSGDEYAALDRL